MYREFWGVSKRQELLESLKASDFEAGYRKAEPAANNRYSLRPSKVSAEYLNWPKIPDLAIRHFNGPVERRAFALISVDRDALEDRMKKYFDPSVSDSDLKELFPSLMMTGNRIVGADARKKILGHFHYDASRIVKYPFKPLDLRWCYLENLRPLFSEPSPELLVQRKVDQNVFFITRDTADKDPEGPPFFFSPRVCDYDSISGHVRHFPAHLKKKP
jgi:Type ISP C-terminal specificity domain